ncbi:Protein phosphatase 1 regulatory inhibitor subunit 16B [Acipenser ruthenus]|uniref:Protein phosphatase 1 regulatory inhibitor subunit 16B n=1 Tax=Acipenser ruthenus TaxID=7906 RepID=A0A444UYX3_ACIRT|nr:Protein phosphatase 1 regulatory inhibitor subunit 16B [Acipenser ruthenus]
MANHLDLLSELHYLEKAPSLERLRTAQKRRNQQLKKWAQYEKEMQSKKRKADRERNAPQLPRKRVSFTASCCIDNYEEIAKILLNRGANVNARDNELWTPLHAAATCGHASLVKVLIQQGADLLAVNSDGNMPYDLCEDDPTLDIIEMAMANRGITQEMINEMRVAVEKRMISDIQELLQSRQDLSKTDEQGATLLHIAAANERCVLISSPSFQLHIAAANERCVLISSPSFQLHIAAANGYIQAAELLLEQGARVDIRDIDGWLPLHAAACWGQIQVAELLVSHGASLNAKTYLDETPIDLCEDEEFKAMLLDLKHKHDIIMKSQLTHKTSLCRRTSSTGSRGKVVRRASVSNRNNRYRKEYETEAIVWLGGKKPEEREGDERERESNQENTVPCLLSCPSVKLAFSTVILLSVYPSRLLIHLCEDEEFKAMLLDLKHKHDIIMKSQLTHKTSLCRRTSSTGSRGKVVRRASVSNRNNRYRKEYETEAIVWLGGKKPEEREGDERERESDQENIQKATPEKSRSSKPAKEQKPAGSTPNGKISLSSTATPPPCNGDAPRSPSTPETPSSLTDPWAAYSERGHQTLAELKRQRAATKLLSHPLLNGHLANGSGPAESRLPLVSSNGSSAYYTVTSGDPPLLRLKQPVEEINEKAQGCCTIS